MKFKIETNISSSIREPYITINAPEFTEKIQDIVNYITSIDSVPSQLLVTKNNEIYFIELNKIICFFSKNKCVYVRTKDDIYKIKYKLYELENIFNIKDFIRISNSCIINMNQIVCFDTSILGTITVKMKDNTQENVSKRNVSQIMKILKQRGNLK